MGMIQAPNCITWGSPLFLLNILMRSSPARLRKKVLLDQASQLASSLHLYAKVSVKMVLPTIVQ